MLAPGQLAKKRKDTEKERARGRRSSDGKSCNRCILKGVATSESAVNTNVVSLSAWFTNLPHGVCFLLFLILRECVVLILLLLYYHQHCSVSSLIHAVTEIVTATQTLLYKSKQNEIKVNRIMRKILKNNGTAMLESKQDKRVRDKKRDQCSVQWWTKATGVVEKANNSSKKWSP